METSPLRVYGGVPGDDRQLERRAQFIEAGLELLGAESEPNLTVRGACKQARLAARYFYESFADRDALAVAVFDHVAEGIAVTTLQAVQAESEPAAKTRAGLRNIVEQIARDRRRGRLLFSSALTSTALVQRRGEATRGFARLLGGQAQEIYGVPDDAELALVTEFLVGGVAQTLTSWLDGTLEVSAEEIVEHCSRILLIVAR